MARSSIASARCHARPVPPDPPDPPGVVPERGAWTASRVDALHSAHWNRRLTTEDVVRLARALRDVRAALDQPDGDLLARTPEVVQLLLELHETGRMASASIEVARSWGRAAKDAPAARAAQWAKGLEQSADELPIRPADGREDARVRYSRAAAGIWRLALAENHSLVWGRPGKDLPPTDPRRLRDGAVKDLDAVRAAVAEDQRRHFDRLIEAVHQSFERIAGTLKEE